VEPEVEPVLDGDLLEGPGDDESDCVRELGRVVGDLDGEVAGVAERGLPRTTVCSGPVV